MSDLIGYAVAWKSKSDGVVHVSTNVLLAHEADTIIAAEKILHPTLSHFLIEIYPDSRAIEEVTNG